MNESKDRAAAAPEAADLVRIPSHGREPAGPRLFYHPSRALQRILRLQKRLRTEESSETRSAQPRILPLVAMTVAVGACAGLLELGVFALQVDWLHLVDLNSLRISRHVLWMIPAAEAIVTIPLALALLAPVAIWGFWREKMGQSSGFVRHFAGTVLGTILFLGPLMAIRGLYHEAALVMALGLGFRLRKRIVRPSAMWNRVAMCAGGIAIVALPTFAIWQWSAVRHEGQRAVSLPPVAAPNVLWIVMDTVRADRLSLYGHARKTTPELERWAKHAVTFDEARAAAPWTLPSHVSMFTSLWPHEQGARIDHPYRGDHPTIAEHLGELGYATAGFAANTGMCNACFGVGRGFDTYLELVCNHEVSLRATMLNSALGLRALKTLNKIGIRVPSEFPFQNKKYGRFVSIAIGA